VVYDPDKPKDVLLAKQLNDEAMWFDLGWVAVMSVVVLLIASTLRRGAAP